MLYLAYRHADSFEDAVLANANVGGDNCHRGAALGAVMGAAHGVGGIPPRLLEGLHAREAVGGEIDAYVHALFGGEDEGGGAQQQQQQGGKVTAEARAEL